MEADIYFSYQKILEFNSIVYVVEVIYSIRQGKYCHCILWSEIFLRRQNSISVSSES